MLMRVWLLPKKVQNQFFELTGLPRTREEALAVGASYYFNGRVCRRGHLSPHRAMKTSGRCYECHLERNAPLTRARRQKRDDYFRAKQNNLCGICGGELGERIHIDHIVSVADGGTDAEGNLQATHPECNREKGRRSNFKLTAEDEA